MVDLGGVTREVLTDRDPAFCIGGKSCRLSQGKSHPPRDSISKQRASTSTDSLIRNSLKSLSSDLAKRGRAWLDEAA
jgi:hypothetical protein